MNAPPLPDEQTMGVIGRLRRWLFNHRTRIVAAGRSAANHLSLMARFPRRPTHGTEYYSNFDFTYNFIAARFSTELYELAEVLGLPPPITKATRRGGQPSRSNAQPSLMS
jgi:hypothetical protein